MENGGSLSLIQGKGLEGFKKGLLKGVLGAEGLLTTTINRKSYFREICPFC